MDGLKFNDRVLADETLTEFLALASRCDPEDVIEIKVGVLKSLASAVMSFRKAWRVDD
jgi:hypothetical protein